MAPPVMSHQVSVVFVGEDSDLLRGLREELHRDATWNVESAQSTEEALEVIRARRNVAVLVANLDHLGAAGLGFFRVVRQERPSIGIVVLTANGKTDHVVEAVRLGAQHVRRSVAAEELSARLRRAVDEARRAAGHETPASLDTSDEIIGDSAAMGRLREAVVRLARVDSTVLLVGETGTGKELLARLVHEASPRRDRPFVAVACAALAGELLETELFGQEPGAFTSSDTPLHGRLEEADGGTVFLDEIGDLPLGLQPKFLRFLQDRVIRRPGTAHGRPVNVRIIAATQQDLPGLVRRGDFRADLYYRFASLAVPLPALRTHRDDLSQLAQHIVAKVARRVGCTTPAVGESALSVLAGYAFPGNVRELENLLERAIVLGLGADLAPAVIEAEHLPPEVLTPSPAPVLELPLEGGFERLAALSEHMERDLLHRAIRAWPRLSNNDIAARLGTNRRVLELRLKKYGVGKGSRGAAARRSDSDTHSVA